MKYKPGKICPACKVRERDEASGGYCTECKRLKNREYKRKYQKTRSPDRLRFNDVEATTEMLHKMEEEKEVW